MQVRTSDLGVGRRHTQLRAPAHLRSAASGSGTIAEQNCCMVKQMLCALQPLNQRQLPVMRGMMRTFILQAAKWVGLDSQAVVLRAPQLLQASSAAATDAYVYLLARQRFGQHAAGCAHQHGIPSSDLVCHVNLSCWTTTDCTSR